LENEIELFEVVQVVIAAMLSSGSPKPASSLISPSRTTSPTGSKSPNQLAVPGLPAVVKRRLRVSLTARTFAPLTDVLGPAPHQPPAADTGR
jgi:hypothetical protein